MKKMPVCAPEHLEEVKHHGNAHPMPSEEDFFQAAEVFRQLCDGTRLKLLWLLSVDETCVCDLADTLGITAPAVSHHLRSLRQAGLITYRRVGKAVYYSLAKNKDGMRVRHMLIDALAGGIEAGEEDHE